MVERVPLAVDDLERTSIDGVTVFWTPIAGPIKASLQFRTGRADEPFQKMGISHLVEHLALFSMGRRPYTVDGAVEADRTTFFAKGTIDEVIGFLGEVGRRLDDLPLDRLAAESQVLRTEASRRGWTVSEHLLMLRYGALGFGGLRVDEYGLGSIDGAALRSWAEDRFTADNSAAYISAEPPQDLHFPLRRGPRVPPIDLHPIESVVLPAWAPGPLPGIALGVIIPRDAAAEMGVEILATRLETRLRYDLGRSYQVDLAYMPLGAFVGHGSLYATCLPEDAQVVRDAFVEVVHRFLTTGPTEQELDTRIDILRRAFEDPAIALGELDRAAHNVLIGRPVESAKESLEVMNAVQPIESRDAVVAAFPTAILAGPPQSPPPAGNWHPYPFVSTRIVSGRRYDAASRNLRWSNLSPQLMVATDGVTWGSPHGDVRTILFEDCIGVVAEPGGVRELWGRDGFVVRVVAAEWRGGTDAVARIDAAIPADRFVWSDRKP